jgi:hypothetical protein
MKMLSQPRLLLVIPLAGLLAACSTPQPIRDVAQQGAATVALAEASLRDYVAVTNAQLQARMELVRQDSQRLSADESRRELDRLLDEGAGIAADDEMEQKILQLAAQRRKIREKETAAREQIAAATQLDPEALGQVPIDKLAEARKRFAVLSEELSATEWIALTAGYAQQISDEIKALRAEEKPQ